jgi:hypothetical protein
MRLLPLFAFVHFRNITGAITTSPSIRIGTNGTHDNLCPIFTPSTSVATGQVLPIPLASPLIAPAITVSDIVLELQASAVGPTTMIADIILVGLLLG